MKNLARLAALSAFAILAVACDDDDSNGGPAELDWGHSNQDASRDAFDPIMDSAIPDPDDGVLDPDSATVDPDEGVGGSGGTGGVGGEGGTGGIGGIGGEGGTGGTGGSVDPGPWPIRTCDHTIKVRAPGATSVYLAGEFNGWSANALPLLDDDRDGVFERRLRAEDGLAPGELYAYKFVIDGQWQLDPENTHRKYVDNCVNSAFLMPACDERPLIVGSPVETRLNGNTGSATATIDVQRASDAVELTDITFTLDGAPIEATQDAETFEFSVTMPNLSVGRHNLAITAVDALGREALPVDLPFWIEAEAFDWRDTVLYLLFVDRFANGNRNNDLPLGDPVPWAADWHGGDLEGALAVMQTGYFESMGIKAIWLTPINDQVEGHFDEAATPPHQIAPYHGYWPIRARDVEPRVGGDTALKAFVDEAHRRGIRVLLDLINNQVHEQHEYVDAHPSWFRTGCVCGTAGCGWSERPFDCLFAPYLPDINWREAETERQFIADAVHWIEAFGVDGFRVDAVKHVETNSIYNLRAELSRRFEQGGTRLVMLGETAVGQGDTFNDGCGVYYASGYDWISSYTGKAALDGQFDFPTHHRIQNGLLTGSMSFRDIDAAIAAYEAQYADDALHVEFLGSHDSSRMATRAAGAPNQNCKWIDRNDGNQSCNPLPWDIQDEDVYTRLKLAFTLLLTIPGIPLLYNGDEIAMPGGNDPDNRRDMRWSGALASLANTQETISAQQEGLRDWLRMLAGVRGQSRALTRGARAELYKTDSFYAYARYTNDDLAVVLLNKGSEAVNVTVGFGPIGRSPGGLEPAIGPATLTLGNGDMQVSVPAHSATVLLGQ